MPPLSVVLGEFEQLILLALVRLGPDAYGATVRREIEQHAGREVSISAVYTTLERLEQRAIAARRLPGVRRHDHGHRTPPENTLMTRIASERSERCTGAEPRAGVPASAGVGGAGGAKPPGKT